MISSLYGPTEGKAEAMAAVPAEVYTATVTM